MRRGLGISIHLLALGTAVAFYVSTLPRQHEEVRVAAPVSRILPNECAIIATEAAARLAATGAWTRIIFIKFIDPHDHRVYGHALVVWQPPTTKQVCIYDASGTYDLATESHDAFEVALAYAARENIILQAAHYL